MLLTVTLVCLAALAPATLLLLLLGARLRFASRLVGGLASLVLVALSGQVVADLLRLRSDYVLAGQALVATCCLFVVSRHRHWNPVGQLFFGTFLASVVAYLAFAAGATFNSGLSLPAMMGSLFLLGLEVTGLAIAGWFTFESIDVTCRVRWARPITPPDPTYRPKVSLHIPAYNEPPDMLIRTIRSVEAIDYPNLEIVVIDNNTEDPDVWKPIEEYCAGSERVKFVHVEKLEGFKSGALNLVMRSHIAPDAAIVGVIDADYEVDPDYLEQVVGYFADPNVAFVQTPQDYREYSNDPYLTACYDAYKYFFETSMPSRNERNAIIFAGTMGLIRRLSLEELGGWDEWCITEDAEASLRMLRMGHDGVYVHRSFGRGIMPLTFGSFKRQRFRWCFGGIQILRKHYRSLLPWDRDPDNHLTTAQRLNYLAGGLGWVNDLVNLGFSLVLLVAGLLLLATGRVAFRPLLGVAVMLPAALIATGLLRAFWALRHEVGIGSKRAALAFLNWLSVSWTVAVACLQGLVRKEGVFLRTPKFAGKGRTAEAFAETWVETGFALLLWGVGAVLLLRGRATPFLAAVFAWQGTVYASAPGMALLNARAQLSDDLERRRTTEILRERSRLRPLAVGAAAALGVPAAAMAILAVLGGGPETPAPQPFTVPERAPADRGPLARLGITGVPQLPSLPVQLPAPSPSPAVSPGPDGSVPGIVTPSPEPTPTRTSPTPSPTPSAAVTPSPEPSSPAVPSPSPEPSPVTTGVVGPAAPVPSPVPAP